MSDALKAFEALRSDVEQFDNHPAEGEGGLFSNRVPLPMKSYLVNWLRRFMRDYGDEVRGALSNGGRSRHDRTAQSEPLTTGQNIVAWWETSTSEAEPADLADKIDEALSDAFLNGQLSTLPD